MATSNSKQILCLSGWGQKFDSLEFVFSESFFVRSLDYSGLDSTEKFFTSVTENPDVLVGWSLGGQLAIRLIEKKILQPKLLILFAPPFQMIKDSRIQAGMARASFDEFYKNFSAAPTQTLKQFAILTAMNDRNAAEIARSLDVNENNFEQLKFWLEELARFSCFDIDFSNMPRTLYFHGAGDMIVHPSQAEYFCQGIKNFRLEILSNCGHAPHLSDPKKIRKIVSEEIAQL
ncbi:MAG: alpha/beta hydrolase [Alphaproteobacteria bacterium]|nr:alpha/beta hydrolase [Alphaproteobacteria bacterium]